MFKKLIKSPRNLTIIGIVLVALVVLSAGGYYYFQRQKEVQELNQERPTAVTNQISSKPAIIPQTKASEDDKFLNDLISNPDKTDPYSDILSD